MIKRFVSNAKTCTFPQGQWGKCEYRQMKTNACLHIKKGNEEKEMFIGNAYWDDDKKSLIGFSKKVNESQNSRRNSLKRSGYTSCLEKTGNPTILMFQGVTNKS